MRAIYSTLPFTIVPGRMVIELDKYVVLWVNAFPPKSGISKTYSPRTIMTGTTLDYKKHFQLEFGAYADTHDDKEKTNNMVERTGGAICLGPSTNFQGGYKFLSLRSGRKITRHQFYAVQIPTTVRDHMHAMADKESNRKR